MTPAGTSNELDVQNEWEENIHTHTPNVRFCLCSPGSQLNVLTFFLLTWECSESLDAIRFSIKIFDFDFDTP